MTLPNPLIVKAFLRRGACLWIGARILASAVLLLTKANPFVLDATSALFLVAITVALGTVDTQRNHERTFLGNLAATRVVIPLLVADCVGQSFGGRRVLTSASLRAVPGEIRALVGRNGIGKTTLLACFGNRFPLALPRIVPHCCPADIPITPESPMRNLTVVAVSVLCACSATAPGNSPVIPKLEVTERSATTLSLRWDAMDTASTYSVDVLTGIAKCTDFPTHNTILVIKGTTTQLTGLVPATRYHVHVHPLPLSTKLTNTVFVMTLAAGAPAQAVAAADYERCTAAQ